jgi:hypothetical protein
MARVRVRLEVVLEVSAGSKEPSAVTGRYSTCTFANLGVTVSLPGWPLGLASATPVRVTPFNLLIS